MLSKCISVVIKSNQIRYLSTPVPLISSFWLFDKIYKPTSELVVRQSHTIERTKMDTRITIGQMRATNDKYANRRQVGEIVERGAKDEASVSLKHIL